MKSKQLFAMAVPILPALRNETLRTFHARYVLPVRRAQAIAEGRPRKPRRKPVKGHAAGGGAAPRDTVADRLRIRALLLDFARDMANAESRAEIVAVLADIDRYVDEILHVPAAEPEATAA